ncbi:MAG: hypothetical protein JO256_08975 [Alphaproteobacteria bacterium]|nr:hypothetical protein [Alphaproteobacteria bacterium]
MNKILIVTTAVALASGAAFAQGAATGGSAGTASGNGLSASTAGIGATSGNSSALAMGGSAAGGRTQSRAAVHGNNNLNGQAMAQAHDGGDFAKSHTVCHDKSGDSVECRTKTMAHEPGSKPVMSTTTGGATVEQ